MHRRAIPYIIGPSISSKEGYNGAAIERGTRTKAADRPTVRNSEKGQKAKIPNKQSLTPVCKRPALAIEPRVSRKQMCMELLPASNDAYPLICPRLSYQKQVKVSDTIAWRRLRNFTCCTAALNLSYGHQITRGFAQPN